MWWVTVQMWWILCNFDTAIGHCKDWSSSSLFCLFMSAEVLIIYYHWSWITITIVSSFYQLSLSISHMGGLVWFGHHCSYTCVCVFISHIVSNQLYAETINELSDLYTRANILAKIPYFLPCLIKIRCLFLPWCQCRIELLGSPI